MGRPASRFTSTLVILAGIAMAVAGMVVGKPLAASLPYAWVHYAPLVLGAVALVECVVALAIGAFQRIESEQGVPQRNLRRRLVIIALIALAEGLAVIFGAVTNVAADSLPSVLAPYVLPFFALVTGLIALVSVLLYVRQSAPPVNTVNRKNFLVRLQVRYRCQAYDTGLAVPTSLGLHEVPAALAHPSLTKDSFNDQVRAGTSISQINDAAGGRLLILGDPGAGKTSSLVTLALDLVARARSDTTRPIPVIFNLHTWAFNRLPLAEWLVEELLYSYQVPRQIAQGWIAAGGVLPLLDGFDEVMEPYRAACAQAINAFAQDHPQLPIVVCSRSAEYRAQPVRLALQAAVEILPLTDEQIVSYLASGGTHLVPEH